MRAPLTLVTIPCAARPMLRAYPSSSALSLADLPCALRTLIALSG